MAHPVGEFSCGGERFRVVRSLDAGRFTVTERMFPPHYREAEHFHARPYLQKILAGSLKEAISFRTGDLGFQPAAGHSTRVDEGGLHILVAEMPPGLADGLSAPANLGPARFSALSARLVGELASPDRFTPLAVEGILLEMLAAIGRLSEPIGKAPPWLNGLVDRLRSAPGPLPTLEQLAADVGVHPATLSRSFRKQYGQSPSEFLRSLRLERACELLRGSDYSIGEVAVVTGFTDQSHLRKALLAETGLSPAAFRAASRKRSLFT